MSNGWQEHQPPGVCNALSLSLYNSLALANTNTHKGGREKERRERRREGKTAEKKRTKKEEKF